jgi:RNA polymerase sigma-70 factor (ECF subfamily)
MCTAYWYPTYAFIRHRGHSVEEAEDLTQEFFARVLEKSYLADARRERGRFRSFLLASVRHFLANEWDRTHAQKRGGVSGILSLDFETAEGRFHREPAHELTPEALFEKHWALTVLDRVLDLLRAEYDARGQSRQFEQLKPFLIDAQARGDYQHLAVELETSAGALKVAVHRLRQRYGELLRAEIAQTVADPSEVDEEIRYLVAALGRP